ncbi:enolase C-terminal domain-like protein [Streptomyces sp. CB01580]|uniref:enolase C-terminal domain-like protein n=1 Tax=Streptomyces sp. CB01580 TaxID=1703933 RepID=UPI001160E3E1|nr:enolase C-terminal domain-like protein [Streptomyces sp. CB01580]
MNASSHRPALDESGRARLRELGSGPVWFAEPGTVSAADARALADADIALGNPGAARVAESPGSDGCSSPRSGIDGYLGLDWPVLGRRLTVTNLGEVLADPVAESCLAGILALHRFLEEPLGPARAHEYPALRRAAGCPVAGGETVTTARELLERVAAGYYDMVQPDATVVGGPRQTLAVFAGALEHGVDPVVHCWGSAVCQAANHHAACAGGGRPAEWPMPSYPLRSEAGGAVPPGGRTPDRSAGPGARCPARPGDGAAVRVPGRCRLPLCDRGAADRAGPVANALTLRAGRRPQPRVTYCAHNGKTLSVRLS